MKIMRVIKGGCERGFADMQDLIDDLRARLAVNSTDAGAGFLLQVLDALERIQYGMTAPFVELPDGSAISNERRACQAAYLEFDDGDDSAEPDDGDDGDDEPDAPEPPGGSSRGRLRLNESFEALFR